MMSSFKKSSLVLSSARRVGLFVPVYVRVRARVCVCICVRVCMQRPICSGGGWDFPPLNSVSDNNTLTLHYIQRQMDTFFTYKINGFVSVHV